MGEICDYEICESAVNEREKLNVENLTVIIKPTHNCNLRCKYCYVDKNAEKGIMNKTTLENSIKKIAFFNGKGLESCFIWHGGEPLLVGLDFYKEVIRIQRELGEEYKFKNGIQTNGTLITEETADFFKNNDFSVGLSLDGPKEINDRNRLYKRSRNGNNSTFADVLKSIELLKKKEINLGIVVVVNKYNVNELPLIYQFLKEYKLDARVNPIFNSGRAIENYEEVGISQEEHTSSMLELINMWTNDQQPISLTFFEEIIKALLPGKNSHSCVLADSCQKRFISIGPQGDVYPCGELDGIREFRYGNINENSLENILTSPLRRKLLERAEKIEECKGCEYKKFCYGGCMSYAYAITGNIMNKDPHCPTYQKLFEYILVKFDHIFKNLNFREVKNGNT